MQALTSPPPDDTVHVWPARPPARRLRIYRVIYRQTATTRRLAFATTVVTGCRSWGHNRTDGRGVVKLASFTFAEPDTDRSTMKTLYTTLAAALCAACILPAAAQAPAAAPSKTGTLGETKSTNNKILTREELRACMKRQDAIRQSRSSMETQRSALDAERVQIESSAAALTAERSAIDEQRSAIAALSARFAEHKTRVEDWNARMAQMQERRPTDRALREMDLEKKAIEQSAVALEAERNSLLPVHEAAVGRYNTSVQQRDQRIGDWNARNLQQTEAERNAENERLDWMDGCSGRRFREDDEAAIKAGK